MMTTEERIDALTEAQDLIFQAIAMIECAVSGTGSEGNVEAYLLARLKIAASDEHGYMTRDQNLADVIRMLQEEEAGDGGCELTDEDEAALDRARSGWLLGDL